MLEKLCFLLKNVENNIFEMEKKNSFKKDHYTLLLKNMVVKILKFNF